MCSKPASTGILKVVGMDETKVCDVLSRGLVGWERPFVV